MITKEIKTSRTKQNMVEEYQNLKESEVLENRQE